MILTDITNLNKRSKDIITVSCDDCGIISDITYISYTRNGHLNGNYLCRKCKTERTCLEKYGVTNPSKSKDIKDKKSETTFKNYGVENPFLSKVIRDKVRKTNIEKYGVENVFQSDIIKDKISETNIEKYGVDNPSKSNLIKDKKRETTSINFGVEHNSQSDIVKRKKKETTIKNYGVDHHFKSNVIKESIRNTNLVKYGVDNPAKNESIKEKLKHTCLEKYETEYYYQSEDFKNKSSITSSCRYGSKSYKKSESFYDKTKIGNDDNYIKYLSDGISLFKCVKGHDFEIKSDNYYHRLKNNISLCTICNPIGEQNSIKEKDLLEFIANNYTGEIISSYRDKLEIDIYLPELNLGFEFNGLYWHSEKFKDKNYHINKTNHFKNKGIRIIHIWEDDWLFRKDIIKSQILNIFGKSKKIYARKCSIKEVGVKDARLFLDNNHIQGFVNSVKKIGIYYENELVSIMTFDHNEGRKKMAVDGWNLSRFCNKLEYNVVGGASKLLNYFIREYKTSRVISYADKDWSIGNLYYALGFENIGDSIPDYKYIVDGERVHKSRYKKDRLGIKDNNITESQRMMELNIHRIYDCGKIKFEKVM